MINKKVTPIPKRKKPMRSKKYLSFIREKPCFRCYLDAEAHHEPLLGSSYWGMRVKGPDNETIPLCGDCHREGKNARHKRGCEEFWCGTDWKSLIKSYQREYQEIKK